MSHKHDGPFFTGTLLKLHTQRPEAIEFNVLQAQINNRNVTTLRGDRLLDHHGYVQVSQGVAIGMNYDPLFLLNGATGVTGIGSGAGVTNEMQWRNMVNLRSNINVPEDTQTTHGPTPPHHLVTYLNHRPVFVLSAEGGVTAQGRLSAANGTFVVSPQGNNLHLTSDLPLTTDH